MRKQAINLFIFSFICFVSVLIFGSILGPLKNAFPDPEVIRNISLFHNHFDQLCWLGSPQSGVFSMRSTTVSWFKRVLKVFTVTYMLGTLLFSFGFLSRASGTILHAGVIEKTLSVVLISFVWLACRHGCDLRIVHRGLHHSQAEESPHSKLNSTVKISHACCSLSRTLRWRREVSDG